MDNLKALYPTSCYSAAPIVNNKPIPTTNNQYTDITLNSSDVTFVAGSSPISKIVVGNSEDNIAVYNIKSSNAPMTITEITFEVSNRDAITSVRLNGNIQSTGPGLINFPGINISVPAGNAGVNIPVSVKYGNVNQYGGMPTQTSPQTNITLKSIKYSNGITVKTLSDLNLTSASMQVAATRPLVSSVSNSGTALGVNGSVTSQVKLGSIRVMAHSGGDISLGQLSYSLTAPSSISNVVIKIGGATISDTVSTLSETRFTNNFRIQAGSSVSFDIYGDISTIASAGTASVSLGAKDKFLWSDINGSSGQVLTGTLLSPNQYQQ